VTFPLSAEGAVPADKDRIEQFLKGGPLYCAKCYPAVPPCDDCGWHVMMEKVAEAYSDRGAVSWEDGLVVRGERWWVSLRSSNTEPLLRLNVEAADEETMAAWRDETLRLVRGEDNA
jgi:phosphomannomutase